MDQPLSIFAREFARASSSEPFDATRAALATVDEAGRVSVRFVLVKEHGEDGFCFYTNYDSRKATELDATGQAALAFHWASTGVQIRVEGPTRRAPAARSDAYFASRPRGSQIGAWASPQSRPIASHDELLVAVREAEARFAGQVVPRPPFWGGYVLTPERIEVWRNGEDRLHERLAFTRDGEQWRSTRLAP